MRDFIPVRGAADIHRILNDTDFRSVYYADRWAAAGDRLGRRCALIDDMFGRTPLFLDGDRHRDCRLRVDRLISDGFERMKWSLPATIGHLADRLLAPGRRDAMAVFVAPLVDRVLGDILDIPLEMNGEMTIAGLFDSDIDDERYRQLSGALRSIGRQISDACPDASADEISDRIAVCILGADALRGTLGCSLQAIFRANDSDDIDWVDAKVPPMTGLPYVDREAAANVTINGRQIAPGAVLRACLDEFESGEDVVTRMKCFGTGPHACSARVAVVDIWSEIVRQIRRRPVRLSVVEFALKDAEPFNIPETLVIDVAG